MFREFARPKPKAPEPQTAEIVELGFGTTVDPLDAMMDDAMAEPGDEDETDKIVSQVLDEIGISFGDEIPLGPSLGTGTQVSSSSGPEKVSLGAGGVGGPTGGNGGGGGGEQGGACGATHHGRRLLHADPPPLPLLPRLGQHRSRLRLPCEEGAGPGSAPL